MPIGPAKELEAHVEYFCRAPIVYGARRDTAQREGSHVCRQPCSVILFSKLQLPYRHAYFKEKSYNLQGFKQLQG